MENPKKDIAIGSNPVTGAPEIKITGETALKVARELGFEPKEEQPFIKYDKNFASEVARIFRQKVFPNVIEEGEVFRFLTSNGYLQYPKNKQPLLSGRTSESKAISIQSDTPKAPSLKGMEQFLDGVIMMMVLKNGDMKNPLQNRYVEFELSELARHVGYSPEEIKKSGAIWEDMKNKIGILGFVFWGIKNSDKKILEVAPICTPGYPIEGGKRYSLRLNETFLEYFNRALDVASGKRPSYFELLVGDITDRSLGGKKEWLYQWKKDTTKKFAGSFSGKKKNGDKIQRHFQKVITSFNGTLLNLKNIRPSELYNYFVQGINLHNRSKKLVAVYFRNSRNRGSQIEIDPDKFEGELKEGQFKAFKAEVLDRLAIDNLGDAEFSLHILCGNRTRREPQPSEAEEGEKEGVDNYLKW